MANFGEILSNIAMAASTAIRRNAADTAFEAFTPATTADLDGRAVGPALVMPRTLTANQTVPTGSDIYVPFGVTINATITLQGDARMIFIQPEGRVIFG